MQAITASTSSWVPVHIQNFHGFRVPVISRRYCSPSSPLPLALKFSSTSSFVVILKHLGEGTLNRHFFSSELWPFVSFCTYLCLVHKDATEEFWLGPRLTTQSWDNVLVRWATISAFLSNSISIIKTSTLCVTVLPCIMTVTNVKWLNEWV